MSKVVLDALALLALLNAEKGTEVVQELLSEAIISTVNPVGFLRQSLSHVA